MEVLLILAVVVGVAVGVGFTTWQLSRQVKASARGLSMPPRICPRSRNASIICRKRASEFTASSLPPHKPRGSEQRSWSLVVGRKMRCRNEAGSEIDKMTRLVTTVDVCESIPATGNRP
jgi:hypothetical protein